jgi:hypothetical protein
MREKAQNMFNEKYKEVYGEDLWLYIW